MINNVFLSVIIPVYNEERHLEKMLDSLFSVQLPNFVKDVEYIVVDDCSLDNSVQIATKFEKENLSIVKHDQNKGKGAAVHSGIKKAKGDVFVIQDADLELSPSDIVRMLEVMNELNVDFVNGSRYLQGIARPMASYRRYLGNKVFSILTSVLLNVRITDMACGYKLFTREIYEALDLKEQGFGFEAELIVKALKYRKNNVAEVPVQYFPRDIAGGKKLKNIDGIKIFKTILKYAIFEK